MSTPSKLIEAAAKAIEGVLPHHAASLTLSHNEHKANYATVEEHISFFNIQDEDWVSPEQRDKAFATQEIWVAQWYPDTPVGSCSLYACEFSALMLALVKVG